MNNIEITLKGDMALAYIQNEKLGDASIAVMQDKIAELEIDVQKAEDRAMYYYDLYTNESIEHTTNVKVPTHLKEQLAKHKAIKELGVKDTTDQSSINILSEEEIDMLLDVDIPESKPKYKSRLVKQDRLDLDEYVKGKCTEKCNLTRFAKDRNVRESTIITYVGKHSDNKYRLVTGVDVSKWDRDTNNPLDDHSTYIRLNK